MATRATKKASRPHTNKQSGSRKLKPARYASFKLSKPIKHEGPPVRSAFKLFSNSVRHIWRHKKILGGLLVTYALLSLVLVRGFGGGLDIRELQASLSELFAQNESKTITTLTVFGALMADASTPVSDAAGVYQSVVLVIMSLAVIWTLRQTYEGREARYGDAFYKSQYPLVPFLLVLLVISLQLIPLAVGSFLYSLVIGGGLATTIVEQAIWGVLIFLLVLLSLYMLASSLLALYAVTLPNMRPLQALRSSRELVRHRRWAIIRKLLFLPLALLLLAAAVTIPVIVLVPAIASWVFFAFSLLALVVSHSYIFALYRELL